MAGPKCQWCRHHEASYDAESDGYFANCSRPECIESRFDYARGESIDRFNPQSPETQARGRAIMAAAIERRDALRRRLSKEG